MASVTAMPVMHEQMHEGTSEERQPYEQTEDVRAVLGEQQRAGNDSESDENKSCAGGQKAAVRCFVFTMRMILHRPR